MHRPAPAAKRVKTASFVLMVDFADAGVEVEDDVTRRTN